MAIEVATNGHFRHPKQGSGFFQMQLIAAFKRLNELTDTFVTASSIFLCVKIDLRGQGVSGILPVACGLVTRWPQRRRRLAAHPTFADWQGEAETIQPLQLMV